MTASVHPFPARRAPSPDPLMSLVATDLNHVNSVILERMQREVPLIPELAGHLIASGGNRKRPILTLAAARLLDHAAPRHHTLAAGLDTNHPPPPLPSPK